MSETKIFRVSGRIDKPGVYEPFTFNTKVSAAKAAHALEKIYAEMGSRHRAKRFQIKINSIKEVLPDEEA
ncbi:MAG: 50S ribosomal protein L18Ae [Candidatus Bathyarchaeota archaeon]|jgi:ribosomal protein L20A (L18A)|nr:50S ribosomal protein L18Ae [Candidatus Bathyarchaeota archaeon]